MLAQSQAQVWGVNDSRTEYRQDAGLQGDAGAKSGFFQANSPVNFPVGATGWWHLLDVRHSEPYNNYAMQLAGGFFDQNLYFRKTNNNPSQSWSKILLETDGKVGIGTLSPTAKLHLSGTYDANTAAAVKMFYQGSWGTADYATNYRFLDIASTENGKVLQVNGTGIGIGTDAPVFNSPDKLYVTGNVGIGTRSPDAKLAVNGTIHSKEVKVDMNNFPDYVFDESYTLRPLKEVETYINKNRHLPDMPSASEVAKQGLNLGEAQALLVKKVEELTLYLIELKNENQVLNERVKRLENKK